MDALIEKLKDNVDAFEEQALSPETNFTALPVWDSLALISTMAMIASEYRINLSGEEINACKSVRQLSDLIAKRR